jgi:glutathione S-transferase
VTLIPDDASLQLNVRLWDRFFDLYVSLPMQKIVGDRIRPERATDTHGVAEAHATLDMAYGMIEGQLYTGPWITGETFTMADCSALPALFFALVVHPAGDDRPQLHDYFERLLARPTVRRVLAEAQPYFKFFPYREAMPTRFLEPMA